ncbi:lytic transglycosylase domain-containing protein [Neotabrizicola shimadae]|uniref:Lytic transglycosylase domain-containing protein n=1 Tax=Neotabrizicola shimadae TaxID=2807096 RepID=A0A8G1EED0_9RHOB|nr:lytic transglycosylase domain-containing protein [Neotabrizicola shimadae]QYZ71186.1 lytic transglycosylase domain-containing protein [Neotabrizicola shimadae]
MTLSRRSALSLMTLTLVAACGGRRNRRDEPEPTAGSAEVHRMVNHWADHYDIPRSLMHRVVKKESNYNPAARNGPYYGLMQISAQTAAGMGYRGKPSGLLDPETNLKYAGKYLRGAWLVSNGSEDRAMMWYQRGYYYEAKRKGLLEETGLRG